MAQSLSKILVHIVFSTKNREPYLVNQELRSELHKYLGGVCRDHSSPSLVVGGVEDHVHILCALGRTIAVADLIREVKRASSKWIKSRDKKLADFHWQGGYGAFSVSQSNVEKVRKYIIEQEDHHRSMSFQDEMRMLFRKHGIEFDEQYVWD